jgi:formate hydrogenlyase transcriptional activator
MTPQAQLSNLLKDAREAIDVETLISLAMEASPVGTLVVDDRGVILCANREAERSFGSPPNELNGRTVDSLLPPTQGGGHVGLRAGYVAEPQAGRMGPGHSLGCRIDGVQFPIEVGLTPVRVESRTFVLASVIDVTDQRSASDEASRLHLDDRLAFQALVSEIAADFVNLPSDRLDEAIGDALRKVVETLDLDRAVVWLREDDSDDFRLTQWWTRTHLPIDMSERRSLKALFPFLWARVFADEVCSYSQPADIPDEVTRANVVRLGSRAGATVGFSIDGQVAGCVSYATMRGGQVWSSDVVGRLRVLSRVFANAIARQRTDRALQEAHAEVKRLSDRLKAENTYLRSEVRQVMGSAPVVGESAAILNALDLAAQVAPTDSSVLLLGETGTGKELFANQVHDLSERRNRLMVRVNCAAIPDTLLESELFGREKGAYTGALTRQTGRFELADKSTIFLDEIGDLPIEVQVKLLRVLEDRQIERLGSSRSTKVDVRIVAATHRNLEEMVAAGTFREDLYYRLNVFPIRVPPLRERPGDIPLLIWRFVDEFSKRFGKPVASIDKGSLAELQHHTWPGNVRELRNLIERAMIVARPGSPLVIPLTPKASGAVAAPQSSKLVDVEIAHMRSVLESCAWRIRGAGGAAERLGLKPSTLETRMAKLGIKRPDRNA